MTDKNNLNLYKVIKSLSYSMDLISETIVGHREPPLPNQK